MPVRIRPRAPLKDVMHTMLIQQRGRLFDLKIPTSLKVVYVWKKGLSLFSHKEFRKGEKIISLKGRLVSAINATPEAVQMTDKKCIDTKYLVPEDFINHHCSPNTKLDVIRRWFVALKDIPKHKEITFNYLTTEWDMKKWGTDFHCVCGSKNCFGHIRGFKYLTRTQKKQLKPLLSPLLLNKISSSASPH